jgi:hypothetical protein
MKFAKGLMLTLCTLALVAGCTTDNPTGPGSTGDVNRPDKVTFNVKWSPKAVLFKADEMPSLKRIDSADFRYYFDANNEKAKGLTAGKIVVINDYAIRKVKSVKNSGGQIIVETEAAELTEAMTDADISWDYGVDVSQKALAKSFAKMAGATTVQTNDSLVVSFTSGVYRIAFVIKPGQNETSISGKMTKEVLSGTSARTARYTLKGTLKKFRSTGHIVIQDGQFHDFTMDNENVTADFMLTAIAAGTGSDIGIELPVPLLKLPIPDLPFIVYELRALLVLNASIPSDGSCDIGMRIQYSTDQGFQFDPQTKNVRPTSNMNWKGFTPAYPPQTAASGPIGVSFGMAYPRVEVNIAGTKTGAWLHTAGLIGGDFTMFPVCRRAKATAILAGGLKLGVPGLYTEIKKTIWQKDTTFFKTGDCPP